MTYDQFIELMNRRRSIRYFSDEPLDEKTVEKILAAGRLAPSVENLQPWHFHVVRNTDLKTKLMSTSCYGDFAAGAAVFIVVSCDRSSVTATPNIIWNPHEMEFSCVAAMHAMMLAATELNIGSCWVSLHRGPAHNLLRLSDHHIIVGGLMFGHTKKGDEEPSRDHQRLPLEKIFTNYD